MAQHPVADDAEPVRRPRAEHGRHQHRQRHAGAADDHDDGQADRLRLVPAPVPTIEVTAAAVIMMFFGFRPIRATPAAAIARA